jgi:hypothetical protein
MNRADDQRGGRFDVYGWADSASAAARARRYLASLADVP